MDIDSSSDTKTNQVNDDDNDDTALDFLISESDFAQEYPDATTTAVDAWNVPLHMQLPPAMQAALDADLLQTTLLRPVTFPPRKTSTSTTDDSSDAAAPLPLYRLLLPSSTTPTATTTAGGCTLVVVWRRVGCHVCREDAQALTELVGRYHHRTKNSGTRPPVHMWGVVPNLQDQRGTQHFQRHYFPFPLYVHDANDTNGNTTPSLYDALGHREVPNERILDVLQQSMVRAVLSKGIRPNMKNFFADRVQGGILVFDNNGNTSSTLRYVYQEQYAEQMDVEAIQRAIEAVLQQQQLSRKATTIEA